MLKYIVVIRENLKNIVDSDVYTRLKPILAQVSKPLVIAGSGPSLQRINYRRLPENFLTFRINNFFLEDKYYLGKDIDLCFQSMPREEAIYTLANTITEYDYNLKSDLIFTLDRVTERFPNRSLFPRVEIEKILSLDSKMYSYILEIFYYQHKHVTSGILSLLGAIALGFKDIYMIGVDFYSDKEKRYAYKIGENYRKSVEAQDLQPGYSEQFHSREIDLKGLDVALSYQDVKVQSICDDAFINQFISLAPEVRQDQFKVEKKSDDTIKDYILLKSKKQNFFERSGITQELKSLKNTQLVKFLWSFFIKPIFIIPITIIIKFIKGLFAK